ncbi:recombinase family protein [Oceanibium sediminis]|uniref:recombinase family protein n=1 Tax=Oceanibium sediminis TaxID=2026339 RepID=UPI001E31E129|nr:recombinase family protein [Oceanibium sediminis]
MSRPRNQRRLQRYTSPNEYRTQLRNQRYAGLYAPWQQPDLSPTSGPPRPGRGSRGWGWRLSAGRSTPRHRARRHSPRALHRGRGRPQLQGALTHARLTGATLVIAKLDRLSRNAAFLLTLRDSGVRYIACDMPEANDLTVGIMTMVAQQEREAISRRTKEALAAAKARGVNWVTSNGPRRSGGPARAVCRSG